MLVLQGGAEPNPRLVREAHSIVADTKFPTVKGTLQYSLAEFPRALDAIM
jgi:hypothetical protein